MTTIATGHCSATTPVAGRWPVTLDDGTHIRAYSRLDALTTNTPVLVEIVAGQWVITTADHTTPATDLEPTGVCRHGHAYYGHHTDWRGGTQIACDPCRERNLAADRAKRAADRATRAQVPSPRAATA